MSVQEKKSFFSTVPGLITGLAGLITATVGLITVSTQMGWIGGNGNGGDADRPTATTVAPGATTPALSFTVSPRQVTFGGISGNEQRVTVQNTGSGPLRLEASITGANRDQFRIAQNDCTATLNAGLSCVVTVNFLATRQGESTANLAVQPAGGTGPPGQEVALRGTRVL
jgi:hypothetical protein